MECAFVQLVLVVKLETPFQLYGLHVAAMLCRQYLKEEHISKIFTIYKLSGKTI